MENITPTLVLLWDTKRALQRGLSVSVGIKNYLKRSSDEVFRKQVEQWWIAQSNPEVIFDKRQLSYLRRHLLEVLEMGLKGHAILRLITTIELELIESCEAEIQNHIALLPMISLLPLMFLIFPSMLILLVAPLLKMLQF